MLTMEDLNKALRRPAGQPAGEQDASDVEADAAGPPATKLREITHEEIANFREQIRWLQNQDHERDNHGQACAVLNIRNLQVPHLEGMFPAAALRHYQPTGIAALVVFEDSEVGGGVLSDEVGTGKTYVVIGLLLYRSNQREDRGKLDIPISRPRVTLLLVPKNLIHSWKQKIMDFTGRFRIVIYYGAAKKRGEHNVEYRGVMTKDDSLFNLTNEENASTIIISTVATWAAQHGPRAQNNWKTTERMRTEKVPKGQE
jgi:SNF2 family DNA or RNA helicase